MLCVGLARRSKNGLQTIAWAELKGASLLLVLARGAMAVTYHCLTARQQDTLMQLVARQGYHVDVQ
ncbi:hypothetical protein [Gallaecimonas sp. GXIMD1310]|uniref:hypothetical protein n=1 Tax=Gallaecimonas sp. GXIMD1310 TaxID=3131926 RepID=UPI0032515EC8